MKKTAYEWSKEFGIQIIDPDGFGERYEGRPHVDELMDISMFNKCITQSTTSIKDKKLWRNRLMIQKANHE